MKRFWERATVVAEEDGGFSVRLDGRPVRLPGGAPLRVARPPLAEAVAEEWNAAGGGARGGALRMEEVPITRLLGTAQERIAPDPAPMVEGLAKYGETDLLCYRADDPRLAGEQAAAWQPVLDWLALQHDAPLRVTQGVMPVAQAPESLAALRRAVSAHGAEELAALGMAVPALGSLALGLALSAGRIGAEEAHRLSVLDELFQERLWGVDDEAARRRERIAAEVALAARFLALARA
ncbi:MAG TPA: ATP12 family chaperone protein [Acetobacteraceae bacterium]|nr:ATP12 family chaperone protein [Acetobacteraceae bacterium]